MCITPCIIIEFTCVMNIPTKKKKSRQRLFLFVLFTLLSSFFTFLSVPLRDFFPVKREERKEKRKGSFAPQNSCPRVRIHPTKSQITLYGTFVRLSRVNAEDFLHKKRIVGVYRQLKRKVTLRQHRPLLRLCYDEHKKS